MSQSSQNLVANAVRALSIDCIEKAKSGHPGAPMGMADIAAQLWLNTMKYNPTNPNWQNRDRFIISNGHASALLYSIMHLVGYDISMDDLKEFRQFGSRTPGHPEYGYTAGIECTSGPLGQGITTAVGFALAEKLYAKKYNRENYNIVDHNTFVFLGDGCLMEGLSQEAISLASTFELGRLIALYDDNEISIDGNVKAWFRDDTPARFEANGWHVIRNIDGHDAKSIQNALESATALATADNKKPILICFKTVIGYGSAKKAGTSGAHGAPLGEEEAKATKLALGADYAPFEIPQNVYEVADRKEIGSAYEAKWNTLFADYANAYPELAKEFQNRVIEKNLSTSIQEVEKALFAQLNADENKEKALATRISNKQVLDILSDYLPELIGGSADLSGSVGTVHKLSKAINASNKDLDFDGNYIHYGVREFGMACVMNGLATYGGFLPYGGTFLVFSDYMRSAIRMSALMKQKAIYVLTHDSIGVGEDGPTHQPVEHVPSLRLIPNLNVWRPADTKETAVAWLDAISSQNPTALILSRQNLPQVALSSAIEDIKKGGYILKENNAQPEVILIATGSEVELALKVFDKLAEQGKNVRLVSMPCTEMFDAQTKEYQEKVLPSTCTKRVSIEASATDSWFKYIGLQGVAIGMSSFGESAPASKVFEHFGFTVDAVLEKINF